MTFIIKKMLNNSQDGAGRQLNSKHRMNSNYQADQFAHDRHGDN